MRGYFSCAGIFLNKQGCNDLGFPLHYKFYKIGFEHIQMWVYIYNRLTKEGLILCFVLYLVLKC